MAEVEIPAPVEQFLDRAPFLRSPVRFGFQFVTRWNDDACPLMAAALAFYGLLSIFPLVLAGVALVARFLAVDGRALNDFSHFVASFFPGAAGDGIAAEIQRAVRSIANGPSASLASSLAFASLIWSGRAYFDTLATVLNRIFPGATQRSFLWHQVTLWCLLFGTGALFLFSTGITFALSLLQTWAAHAPRLFINRAPIFWDLLGKSASWFLTFLMFYLLYRYTPNRSMPPKRRLILLAALVGAIGWEGGKWAFTRFLGNVTRYEATYGSVAGVVVTMLWIYYASLIVLLGAEVGAIYEQRRAEKMARLASSSASDSSDSDASVSEKTAGNAA
jgi:membrane protein